ncbi:MAG: flavodoxin family protein [Clostridia bacterium]|nr:flavodoxin family protein [Clostridia bacterium]
MRIQVFNGSPKGEKSDTMKITRAFLDGMGEQAEVIDTYNANIGFCTGCYSCMTRTPGKCVLHDDMEGIIDKLLDSDLVIWSTPLYAYTLPANIKRLLDRLLPLNCMEMYAHGESTSHKCRYAVKFQTILISGGGFPERKGNFDGLEFTFRRAFGDIQMIICPEAPLLSIAEAQPLAIPYLENVKKAGAEFKQNGCISPQTQSVLDALMYPAELYRKGSENG